MLSFFKSARSLTCPFGFNTGTIGEHHSVGSVCLTILSHSSFSIRFNSFSTFGVDTLYDTGHVLHRFLPDHIA